MTQNGSNPKGILNPRAGETRFQLERYLPSDDLRGFVMRYWLVRWHVDTPYPQQTLPYPCVNLVIERGDARIYGVDTGKFVRILDGAGMCFGVKFNPGAFHPFLKTSIAQLTDHSIPISQIFGVEGDLLAESILAQNDSNEMMALMEDFLRPRLPEIDPNVARINQIVDCIQADRTITKVDEVVARLHLNKRTLQRLFREYVGVSPKWVIKLARLQEAAQQLVEGVHLPRLAADLGYFDQTHFSKDFKAVVGCTPAEYAKQMEV